MQQSSEHSVDKTPLPSSGEASREPEKMFVSSGNTIRFVKQPGWACEAMHMAGELIARGAAFSYDADTLTFTVLSIPPEGAKGDYTEESPFFSH